MLVSEEATSWIIMYWITFVNQCKNTTELGTRPQIPDWLSSNVYSYSRFPSKPDLKDRGNKKAQHPVGLFYVFGA